MGNIFSLFRKFGHIFTAENIAKIGIIIEGLKTTWTVIKDFIDGLNNDGNNPPAGGMATSQLNARR